jgi:hypothetical protein
MDMSPEDSSVSKAFNAFLEFLNKKMSLLSQLNEEVNKLKLGKEGRLELDQANIEELRKQFLEVKNKLKTQKAEEEKRLTDIEGDEEEKLSGAIKSMKKHFERIDENLDALNFAEEYLLSKDLPEVTKKLKEANVISSDRNLDLEKYKKLDPQKKEEAHEILIVALFEKNQDFFKKMGIKTSDDLIKITKDTKMDDLHSKFTEVPKEGVSEEWASYIVNKQKNPIKTEGGLGETDATRVAMHHINKKATKISSLGRGFLARRQQKRNDATKIQQKAAATKIQALMRGKIGRIKASRIKGTTGDAPVPSASSSSVTAAQSSTTSNGSQNTSGSLSGVLKALKKLKEIFSLRSSRVTPGND